VEVGVAAWRGQSCLQREIRLGVPCPGGQTAARARRAGVIPLRADLRAVFSSRRHESSASLSTDANDLTWPDRPHNCDASREVRQQVRKTIRLCAKNNDRDRTACEILLVFETLIHRQEDLESVALGQRKQRTVLLAREPRLRHSLAVVAL
jgi:hypothetical protein